MTQPTSISPQRRSLLRAGADARATGALGLPLMARAADRPMKIGIL